MTIRSCFLFLVLGVGAGCVELPLLQQSEQKPAPPIAAAVKKPTAATALVAPEEVTDTKVTFVYAPLGTRQILAVPIPSY